MLRQQRVSFIMPAYNSEVTISQAIESVLNQTIKPYEIIVVNDGSTDGTAAIASQYPIKLLHKENGGVASALNIGLEDAKGDYIAIVESDVIIPPNWTEVLLQDLGQDHSIMGAGAILKTGNPQNTIARLSGYELEQSYQRIKKKFVPHITAANSLYRKDAFDIAGKYDEGLKNACNDAEFNGRLITKGYRLSLNKDIQVLHFWKEDLSSYLKRQFAYAFYRPFLTVKYLYPTDRSIKMQMILVALSVFSVFLWPWMWLLLFPFYFLTIIFLGLFFLWQTFRAFQVFRQKDDFSAFWIPLLVFLKSLVGMTGYSLGYIYKKVI